ncbi:unnamed protein product [Amoebophrya sp. A120]|nr:unnamed protein product [Amoebophrya sp. A120]|eukprot:GSA120T00013403001.1
MAYSQTLSGSDRGLHIVFLGDPEIGQSTLLKYFRKETPGTVNNVGVATPSNRNEILDFSKHRGQQHEAGGSSPSSSKPADIIIPEHQSCVLDQVIENEPFRIRFTDSGGLSVYDKVRKPILRTAHLVVLCFSCAKKQSLASVKEKWLPLVRSLAFLKKDREEDFVFLKPVILLGLQTDLRASSSVAVTEGEASKFANEAEAISYLECSLAADPDEALDALRTKILSTAKESYLFRWQQKRIKRSLRGESDQAVDMGAADVDKYVAEALTVEQDTDPLAKEQITQNLSCLGVTPYMSHAYLQCDLPDLGLTSCDALRGFPNLQYLDISNNQLRSLEPLGELPFLLRLNASRNQMVRTQSFGPPRHLESIDLSYNLISELGDWRTHKMLRELNLRGNFISEIDGIALRKNSRLKMLDLSENHIFKIQNLAKSAGGLIFGAEPAENAGGSGSAVQDLERLKRPREFSFQIGAPGRATAAAETVRNRKQDQID